MSCGRYALVHAGALSCVMVRTDLRRSSCCCLFGDGVVSCRVRPGWRGVLWLYPRSVRSGGMVGNGTSRCCTLCADWLGRLAAVRFAVSLRLGVDGTSGPGVSGSSLVSWMSDVDELLVADVQMLVTPNDICEPERQNRTLWYGTLLLSSACTRLWLSPRASCTVLSV